LERRHPVTVMTRIRPAEPGPGLHQVVSQIAVGRALLEEVLVDQWSAVLRI
jgi:hypothetical protein